MCMSVYDIRIVPKGTEEEIVTSGTGVPDGCGHCELNPGPLQEQGVLLTAEL